MRAVVERVSEAHVDVAGSRVGAIGKGLLVLLGVEREDSVQDVERMADKVTHLRLFEDDEGRMNLSLADVGGSLLAISQFTLLGDCRKGRRPSYDRAASPEHAEPLYRQFIETVRARGIRVESGTFRAHMAVSLVNDGPVTLLLDSRRLF